MGLPEAADQRQQRVDRRLVGADEHASAPQVAQFAHGDFGFLAQAHEPLRVLAQHAPGLGERALLGRPIEEPLTQFLFEPADGLADGRLGAVQLGGGAREAALAGDRQENLQFREFHGRDQVRGFTGSTGSRVPAA